jgi:hypothetical protein
MQSYWSDVTLLLQRIKGTKPVVVHVEPDLWGDQLAPNVRLAYHMSGWGTKHDMSSKIRPMRP